MWSRPYRPLGFPIYVARVPAAPFVRCRSSLGRRGDLAPATSCVAGEQRMLGSQSRGLNIFAGDTPASTRLRVSYSVATSRCGRYSRHYSAASNAS